MNKYFLLMMVGGFFCSAALAESQGVITAEIKGIKETPAGNVICAIFDSKEGFPMETSKAVQIKDAKMDGGVALCSFEAPTDRFYAISVVHDKNNNRKVDTNALGIPKEGWATTKNITHTFSPPSFEESKILLDDKNIKTTLEMHY
ncbi:MAG: DUF2141 domain-containing protein [Methylophilaceae bacterium]